MITFLTILSISLYLLGVFSMIGYMLVEHPFASWFAIGLISFLWFVFLPAVTIQTIWKAFN